jgi:hypothetical protein
MRKLLIVVICIGVINLILASVFPRTGKEQHVDLWIILTVGFTAFGFFLGAILALAPYKEISYRKKYLPASLICIFSLHLVWIILELNRLIPIYIAWSKGYC